tara:strand:+ start:1097 stop:1294 length:198 start_codon:yes stop_codon:yes gene_type:complete
MALGMFVFMALWSVDNKEFLETVDIQRADGFTWQQIDCREVDQTLPAITIDTPTGKSLVCAKLTK